LICKSRNAGKHEGECFISIGTDKVGQFFKPGLDSVSYPRQNDFLCINSCGDDPYLLTGYD